jgi:hypothetical protein
MTIANLKINQGTTSQFCGLRPGKNLFGQKNPDNVAQS